MPASLPVGGTAQLTATARLSNGTTQDCTNSATWESSDGTIARVSATGLVTTVAAGEAEIRATYQGTWASVRVKVERPFGSGSLEIHYLDVGQGDAAILMTPSGETVMFDDGPGNCGTVTGTLGQMGATKIDYHIASHYHADHIACAPQVFAAFPLRVGLDRGGSYSSGAFGSYLAAVVNARQPAVPGSTLTLDGGAVTIQIVAIGSGSDENDRSIVAVVHFGEFDAEFGGDLTDAAEPSIASMMPRVEAYKVHHHGSASATSTTWLSAIMPKVAIISVGNGNPYHHPTQSALDRLHHASVKTYWTELGSGATPQAAWDVVAGTVTVEVPTGGTRFTVRWNGGADTYMSW
ncbi:MAG: Ig-like domain-containing protein [Acidobacteria bacterium]|nr:Ig-like domain-containing protein [Acidobacteriota bacterium]